MKTAMLKTTHHMTKEQKEQVKEALLRYSKRFATQAAASESLQSVSTATISLIKNNKWEKVTEHMWQNVARQVGFYCSSCQQTGNAPMENWKHADTGASLLLRILFGDAQRYAMAYGVAIQTGLGKTFCAKHYVQEQEYAYYINCNEKMNRKDFLQGLLQSFGKTYSGSAEKMMQQVIETLETTE